MSSVNKVIKICAKILAALVIAAAVLSVFSVLDGHSTFIFFGKSTNISEDDMTKTTAAPEIDSTDLDIDLKAADLIIRRGEEFSVLVSNDSISVDFGTTLKIEETSSKWHQTAEKVIITMPKEKTFETVDIDVGAGQLTIDEITADRFYLDIGTADVEINMITANANIKCGLGDIDIKDGTIHDLDLELGAGDADIYATLTGEAQIECGVGDLDLTLKDGEAKNRVDCNVGLGSFTVNGDSVKGSRVIGSGANSVEIDGGIGDVSVNFKKAVIE